MSTRTSKIKTASAVAVIAKKNPGRTVAASKNSKPAKKALPAKKASSNKERVTDGVSVKKDISQKKNSLDKPKVVVSKSKKEVSSPLKNSRNLQRKSMINTTKEPISKKPSLSAKAVKNSESSSPGKVAKAQPAQSVVSKKDFNPVVSVLNQSSNHAPNLLDELGSDADPGTLPTDQVFDETDQAQWMQLREIADITRRGLAMNKPEHHPDFDGEHCVDCDDEIPELRLKMQKVRCVDCQQVLEDDLKRQKRLLG